MRVRRIPRTLVAVLTATLALVAGCGSGGFNGMYTVPLPGGAELGEHPYTVTAKFDNVLNLVPQAAVKVNSVTVGNVTSIKLAENATAAIVTMKLNGNVELPENATAQLRQASLLGAKYVALSAPENAEPHGSLDDGDRIGQARTGRTAEIEEVFGALSMLLSGGGIEQIRTIAEELNKALSGNAAEIRALLTRADRLATELDKQKGEIVQAIESLHQLSETLVKQTENLTDALENLGPGLRILSKQQDQLVNMLSSLEELAQVAVETVRKSADKVVANLKALKPILKQLADAGQYLPQALRILPTYPYPAYAGKTIKGDYANVHAMIDLRLDVLIENFKGRSEQILDILPDNLPGGAEGSGPNPYIPMPLPGATGKSAGSNTGTTDSGSGDGGDSRAGSGGSDGQGSDGSGLLGGLLGSVLGGGS